MAFHKVENSIGSVVIEILGYRLQNLILYIIGYFIIFFYLTNRAKHLNKFRILHFVTNVRLNKDDNIHKSEALKR